MQLLVHAEARGWSNSLQMLFFLSHLSTRNFVIWWQNWGRWDYIRLSTSYISFLESVSPYPLQQIAEVGYVGVLFNTVSTLTSSTQHVFHLIQRCTYILNIYFFTLYNMYTYTYTLALAISTYSKSALPHELTDKLDMAVRRESKTTTTTPTRAKTNTLNSIWETCSYTYVQCIFHVSRRHIHVHTCTYIRRTLSCHFGKYTLNG